MENYTSIYFVGAGGIGMSALVRYFLSKKYKVAGYDKTPSALTSELIEEGAEITFDEDESGIPGYCRDSKNTLVVRTPAVPDSHPGLSYFRKNGFTILKRAELLGMITRNSKALCFSGTHGKTTTSSMAAHLFTQSGIGCNAFLGGILKNYNSNLLLSATSDFSVIEADEYDRSFHHLHPYMAVITSTDPDHLDIYGTEEAYLESFSHFTSLIQSGGCLLLKKGVKATPRVVDDVKIYTYSANDEGDFQARNIRIANGEIKFDFVTPSSVIENVELGVPIQINIENGIAAMAIAWLNGVKEEDLRKGMASFLGAKRRFEYWIKTDKLVMIDDYAHHPDELRASISSVRALYPNKKISGIFQPHLYSRTRDFADEFAAALSLLDELILLDIYPAREAPIPGITSEIIFNKVTCRQKELYNKELLLEKIKGRNFDVLITLGAGDIDRMLPNIRDALTIQ